MKKGARKRPGLHSRSELPERAPKPARSTCICSCRNVFSPWPAGRAFSGKAKRGEKSPSRGDEYVKKAALLRASARMKYSVPYDLDKTRSLIRWLFLRR